MTDAELDCVPDACTRSALRELAIEWQIIDPREGCYIMAREEDSCYDLVLLHRRYEDMKDCPRIEEAIIFPPRETLNGLCSFNRAYRSWIELQMQIDLVHQWELRQILVWCDDTYQTLDLIRDACTDYYYVTVRRMALRKLVEKHGSLYQTLSYHPVRLRDTIF
jgi:hypothetical protein